MNFSSNATLFEEKKKKKNFLSEELTFDGGYSFCSNQIVNALPVTY